MRPLTGRAVMVLAARRTIIGLAAGRAAVLLTAVLATRAILVMSAALPVRPILMLRGRSIFLLLGCRDIW